MNKCSGGWSPGSDSTHTILFSPSPLLETLGNVAAQWHPHQCSPRAGEPQPRAGGGQTSAQGLQIPAGMQSHLQTLDIHLRVLSSRA